tara:strand:+ start:1240 stop:2079 length:840 start_codon:yes stop_codon:yes gene_type:complete
MNKTFTYILSKIKNEFTLSRIKEIILIRMMDLPHKLTWIMPLSKSKKNKINLKKYKDLHKGQRCFIIANGPSLKKMDLTPLKDEITIGMNRVDLLKDKIGFLPTYFSVSDLDIMHDQFHQEFSKIKGPIKFFNWNRMKYYKNDQDTLFFKEKYFPHFSKDITQTVYSGHSVTNVCIQIAYFMGFNEVILIGKDHSYSVKGTPGKKIKYSGNEKDHFSSKYYKKDEFYRIPDYKGEELGYSLAKTVYEKNNRKIYDATINGNLNIFEAKEFNSFFYDKKN